MIDKDMLRTKVFFAIRNSMDGRIDPIHWEQIVCAAMGAQWIDGDKFLADGVLGRYILNIKTKKIDPVRPKRLESRDFLSHPDKFKPESVELIQRRTNLPVELDEQQNTPAEIGAATLNGFREFVRASLDQFPGTDTVLDVIVRHGEDHSGNRYLVDIDIFEHHYYDPAELEWREVIGGPNSKQRGKRVAVEGFDNGRIVARRNGSNSGLYQTNYLMYKDLTVCENNHTVDIPMPPPPPFNKAALLEEIAALDAA